LPKALTAVLAGAALAVSGLQMQTLFRNPLADPYILGINAGASLGVALVVLATGAATGFLSNVGLLGDLSLIVAAIAGASLVTGLVIVAARWLRHAMTLLILGLMLGYATGAVVSILIYFSVPEQIQAYISWTFGSFGGVTGRQLAILAPVIGGGLLLAWLLTKPLNALLLGEAYARSMGANVRRVRFWLIAGTSVLAGAVTAFCGPIAFLGVAIPHLCRALLRTSDHRMLAPATMLMGGLAALAGRSGRRRARQPIRSTPERGDRLAGCAGRGVDRVAPGWPAFGFRDLKEAAPCSNPSWKRTIWPSAIPPVVARRASSPNRSISSYGRGNWSACWVPTARANRRCCAPSPECSRRCAAASGWRAPILTGCRRASWRGCWAWCSPTGRKSARCRFAPGGARSLSVYRLDGPPDAAG
jgi:ABC-type Fe3+-siderophore transport system permease subunit